VPAISVGSVEVDVLPNARGIEGRLRAALVPSASQIGDEVGRIIGRQIALQMAPAIRDGINNGARAARPAAARQGDETAGAFSRSLKARLEAAFRSLPRADVTLSTTGFDADMARLRARLETLSGKRIGIDVDAGVALAEIADIEERLKRLGAQHPNVQVRADTAAALAQLAALRAEVDAVDGKKVDVDTSAASASFNKLVFAAIALGPAIIPVLPVIAAGLGAIAAAATAAGAGLGSVALVALPAFKQIGGVLQAQKAAQQAATNATYRGGQASSQAASKALQMASAQQALATAERNGARQIAQAQQQVKQAKQGVAEAIAQAAQRTKQAEQQVEQAEKSLAQAQKDEKRAQLDLTAARKEAARQLEDMNNQLADSQLSLRDAQLQVEEAKQNLDATLANPKATDLQRKQAKLAYDEAVQHLKEQQTATKRAQSDTAAANKAGVEGSKTVKNAQDQLAQSQQNVADRTQALRDAQEKQAQVAQDNAKQIAAAQQRVSEATANVAVAQQNAADAVASAQRQIASASQSAAGGVDQAAIAQSKYQAELAKLTPSARDTLNAFLDLRSAFGAWSKALQPAVMPIFTRALVSLRNTLPTLTPFVTEAADAIKGLQDRASASVKTPFWQGFKKDLQGSVKPAITGLGVAFGNVIKGIAGVIDAFLPHMDGISSRLQGITQRFADWGAGLKGSPEFERFLSFASDKAPILGDALGKIALAFLNVGQALSPISGPLLQLLGGAANFIAIIADKAPWFIMLIYGIILATKLWTLAQLAFNFVMSANPLVLIGLAILALVALVIYAYNKFSWFRDGVKAVWDAIKAGGKAVVDWFSGPFVNFFTKTIPNTFRSVLDWVRRNWPWIAGALGGPVGLGVVYVIKHWDEMKKHISSVWDWIKRWVFGPIGTFFTKTIPGWGTTLKNGIVESFDAARRGIKTAWDKIKGIARAPVQYVVDLVYNNGIRRVWNLVTDAFGGKHLDKMQFASGGITPGYTPGRDVHRFVSPTGGMLDLSGGEAIMRPEWTRAVGPGYVNAMNAAARSGGVGGVRSVLGFKGGGIFDGIGDVLGGAWDKVKSGYNWLKDTFSGALKAGVEHVVNPLIDKIPGGNIGFVGLLKGAVKNLALRLVGAGDEGDKRMTPHVNYKPSAGVEQWRPVVLQALREAGQSAGLANTTLRRMNQESGGNPTIVNRWDSNWQAGHPSVGLMQVIRGTFQHYAGKYRNTGPFSYGVSVNPLANVYSSMKYALAAYGSLHRAYDRPGGYDSGGLLMPGMNLAFNGTGRPEPVLTTQQWNAITGASVRGSDGAQQPVVVELHAKEGALGQFIDVRVQEHDQRLIQVINAS
jgi:phage-related protein